MSFMTPTQLFVQQRNIKAPHYWPFVNERNHLQSMVSLYAESVFMFVATSSAQSETSFLFPNSKSGYSTVLLTNHYSEIIISTMTSQVTGVSAICSTADQRKYESTVSLAFVRRIHWWPVDSPHKGPVMQKMFPFDDVLMHITQIEDSGSLGNLCNFLWGSPPLHLNCVLYWCTLELHIY